MNELGDIFLIDYDSFYCVELQGEKDIITGLVDYQHPLRKTNNIIHEKIDYFSELIIYLSILAIAENPTLVDKYKVINWIKMRRYIYKEKRLQLKPKGEIQNEA